MVFIDPREQFDIIAVDGADEAVLFVEVTTFPRDQEAARRRLEDALRRSVPGPAFAMIVDQEAIRLFAWDGDTLKGPLTTIAAAPILSRYDPDFASKSIYEFYLRSLLVSWIHDLAYGWKGGVPPAMAELDAIGLLERLRGGTTLPEIQYAA
jgi:hypothetical protein